MSADYKSKYMDIRSKLIESVDVAFRDGYAQGLEKGAQQAQEQQMQQQAEMEQQMQQQAAMGQEEGGEQMPQSEEEQAAMMEQEDQQMEMAPEEMGEEDGSELDSHISELEGLISKGERPKILDLRKAVLNITSLRKTQKDKFQAKIAKTVSKQKSVVDNILKKWETESKSVTDNLENIIKEHGITIGK